MKKLKTTAIVSTYGPCNFGWGHDITTEGKIEASERISVEGGLIIFENLLQNFVNKYKIERGQKITISIEKK